MAEQPEGRLQRRLQKLVEARGGYLPKKNHGNMITVKGLSDLSFTFKGWSVYWEVKLPETKNNVSVAQGIHMRLARKAGGITAIISTLEQAAIILDWLELCYDKEYNIQQIFNDADEFYRRNNLDDGTKY